MTPGRHAADRPSPRRREQHRPITGDRDPMGKHSPLDIPLEDSELTTTGLWVDPPTAATIPPVAPLGFGSLPPEDLRQTNAIPRPTPAGVTWLQRAADYVITLIAITMLGFAAYLAAAAVTFWDSTTPVPMAQVSPVLAVLAFLLLAGNLMLLLLWRYGSRR